MEYMKEKIDSSDIPTSYLLCMKQDCPKATTCLRRIAEQQIGDEVKLWHVISLNTKRSKPTDVLISALPIN